MRNNEISFFAQVRENDIIFIPKAQKLEAKAWKIKTIK